jgi:hypothetical protein
VSLKKILADAFSGGRDTPRGTIGTLLAELKRAAGSRRAAGRAAGIGESTLRGWDAGKRPKDAAGATLKLVNAIRKFWRTDPTGGSVRVTIANPGRGPAGRSVAVDPKAMQRAGDAWQRGDLGGMVREFRKGVKDAWYRENLFRPHPDDVDVDEDSQETPDIEQSDPYAGAVAW